MERQSDESLAGSDFLPGFNGAAMQWALWPMQFWLQWQANMLKAVAPTTAEWMERRRQGTEAALHALDRLCACHSAAEASKVQSEWLRTRRSAWKPTCARLVIQRSGCPRRRQRPVAPLTKAARQLSDVPRPRVEPSRPFRQASPAGAMIAAAGMRLRLKSPPTIFAVRAQPTG